MCTGRHWQVAWMSTDSWHRWTLTGGTAGATLIISALMITVSVTAQEERNAHN
ncbi:unnamed protein product, partial [Staurois parvus]